MLQTSVTNHPDNFVIITDAITIYYQQHIRFYTDGTVAAQHFRFPTTDKQS